MNNTVTCYTFSSCQVSVLRGAWSGLFLIGLIQCRHQVDLPSLLSGVASNLQTSLQTDSITLDRVKLLLATLNHIKQTAGKFDCLELDSQEYTYLRLSSLFRFSESQKYHLLSSCALRTS